MPKKKEKTPKISDQSFTRMVEALLGAKVHLDAASKVATPPIPGLQPVPGRSVRDHLCNAFEYLEIIEVFAEARIHEATEALNAITDKEIEERKKRTPKMKVRRPTRVGSKRN